MLYDKHSGHHLTVAYAKLCWDTTQQIISDNVDQGMTIGEAWRNTTAYQAKWLNPPTGKGSGGTNGDHSDKAHGKKRKGPVHPNSDSPREKQRRKAQSANDLARNKWYGYGKQGKSKGKGKSKKDDPWNTWPKKAHASDDKGDTSGWDANKSKWW